MAMLDDEADGEAGGEDEEDGEEGYEDGRPSAVGGDMVGVRGGGGGWGEERGLFCHGAWGRDNGLL